MAFVSHLVYCGIAAVLIVLHIDSELLRMIDGKVGLRQSRHNSISEGDNSNYTSQLEHRPIEGFFKRFTPVVAKLPSQACHII
ncbi:hypothetical protein L218DRAFT_1005378 [Marasmius fiardii PR-910]|nr:hypothetical protein L218DRAFT_1005378 [Marasmius fiardii PR-910]